MACLMDNWVDLKFWSLVFDFPETSTSTVFYKAHLWKILCFLSAHFASHELIQTPTELLVLKVFSVYISVSGQQRFLSDIPRIHFWDNF